MAIDNFQDPSSPTASTSKTGIKGWWRSLTSKPQSQDYGKDWDKSKLPTSGGVFGANLEEALERASVAISMISEEDGKSYVYGYIPIVVAKCGLFLKDNATETEGVFRVPGSSKRMKDLQTIFDSPPRYGKDLVWNSYSVHDAASVFRRYLCMIPDPVIPYQMYYDFRDCLTSTESLTWKISRFRDLLQSLPQSSRALLLYVLDLLAVFARNSNKTLMTASNLAVVFQPGLARPPERDLNQATSSHQAGDKEVVITSTELALEEAHERKRSQEVLEFLIEHQDHFVMELKPSVLLPVPIINPKTTPPSTTKPTSSTPPPPHQSQPPSSNSAADDPTSAHLIATNPSNDHSSRPTNRLIKRSPGDRKGTLASPPTSPRHSMDTGGRVKKSGSLRRGGSLNERVASGMVTGDVAEGGSMSGKVLQR